jgi:hypothetical protein
MTLDRGRVRAWIASTRAAQGLPATVTDPGTLDALAATVAARMLEGSGNMNSGPDVAAPLVLDLSSHAPAAGMDGAGLLRGARPGGRAQGSRLTSVTDRNTSQRRPASATRGGVGVAQT